MTFPARMVLIRPVLFIIVAFATLASSAQTGPGAAKPELVDIVRDRIKSFTVVSRTYEDDTLHEPDHWWQEEYTRHAQLFRSTERNDRQAISTVQCDTNAQGLVVHCLQQQFDHSGRVAEAEETFFDPLHRPVRRISYRQGEVEYLYVYMNGEYGPMRMDMMLPDSTVIYTTTYSYDMVGNCAEEVGMGAYEDSAGRRSFLLDRRVRSTHDGDHRVLERTASNAQGRVARSISTYDADGRPIDYREYRHGGGLHTKRRYTYDKQGNLVESRQVTPGQLTRRELISHDEEGKPTRTVLYIGRKKKSLSETSYEFFPARSGPFARPAGEGR